MVICSGRCTVGRHRGGSVRRAGLRRARAEQSAGKPAATAEVLVPALVLDRAHRGKVGERSEVRSEELLGLPAATAEVLAPALVLDRAHLGKVGERSDVRSAGSAPILGLPAAMAEVVVPALVLDRAHRGEAGERPKVLRRNRPLRLRRQRWLPRLRPWGTKPRLVGYWCGTGEVLVRYW